MSQQGVDRLARAMDDVQYALGESRLEKYLGQPLSPEWRPLGRLEDERVPRDDGEREHPKRDHHREVEGWDAGADADRVAVEILVDAARDVAQGTALEERRRAAREIDHLDAAPHLAPRLLERLAVVARDDRSQLFEVLLEQSLEPEHQAHALHQGCARPAGECPDRRVDRSVDVRLSRRCSSPHHRQFDQGTSPSSRRTQCDSFMRILRPGPADAPAASGRPPARPPARRAHRRPSTGSPNRA